MKYSYITNDDDSPMSLNADELRKEKTSGDFVDITGKLACLAVGSLVLVAAFLNNVSIAGDRSWAVVTSAILFCLAIVIIVGTWQWQNKSVRAFFILLTCLIIHQLVNVIHTLYYFVWWMIQNR